MKYTFTRRGMAIVPYDEGFYSKIKDGDDFTCDIRIVRHPIFHRKYFAMLRIILENLPESMGFKTIDTLREELQFRAGYYTKTMLSDGKELYKLTSISYESLDQLEFEELYNRVLDEGCKILGVSIHDMSAEISALS